MTQAYAAFLSALRAGQHVNASTIAAAFGVSTRTAARYVAASLVLATAVGWSVRYDHVKRSYVLDR